jgi:hypothetical protein
MKKLLLVFALVSLFSCGNDEEVSKSSNQATVSVKHVGEYAITIAYMNKDKWGHEEPFLFDGKVKGDTAIVVTIDRDQNFGYVIQRQGATDGNPVQVTLVYKEKNNTKTLSTPGGMLWDIYEFYKQTF